MARKYEYTLTDLEDLASTAMHDRRMGTSSRLQLSAYLAIAERLEALVGVMESIHNRLSDIAHLHKASDDPYSHRNP